MTTLKVNGSLHAIDGAEETPLLWVIRDTLKMTGTKYGCGVAACGACTVHVDGQPVRSCQMLAEDVGTADVTTIEGLNSETSAAVQQAWRELNVAQCGYCQSGQIMSAVGLLSENANPDDGDINDYMAGNVCRCATYTRIRAAIHRAAEILEG